MRSLSASSALVASSSSRIGALRSIARAMAMRWRWPPESRRRARPAGCRSPAAAASRNSVGVRRFGGGAHLGVGGIGPAIADVVPGVGGEDHRILRHHARCAARSSRADRQRSASTPSTDAAGLRIVEAQQQLEHRGLAGAGGADQRHRLAGFTAQRESPQRRLRRARRIVEGDVVELDRRLRRSAAAAARRRRARSPAGVSSSSSSRSVAPAARCSSPATSLIAPTEVATSTA